MSTKDTLLRTLFDTPDKTHRNIKFFRLDPTPVSEEAFCETVLSALFDTENGTVKGTAGIDESDLSVIDVTMLHVPA